MSKKRSKTQKLADELEQSLGRRPSYRMRELEVTFAHDGDRTAVLRHIVDDRPSQPDAANATWGSSQPAEVLDVQAAAEEPSDALIGAFVEMEDERDEARRMLERARQRIVQQDRQRDELVKVSRRQQHELEEARQRDQANVTRWRDAEARLEQLATGKGTPFMEANAQLRSENAQLVAERDQARHTAMSLGDEVKKLRQEYRADTIDELREQRNGDQETIAELERQVSQLNDQLRDLRDSDAEQLTELNDQLHEARDSITTLKAQLAEANRNIDRLAPF